MIQEGQVIGYVDQFGKEHPIKVSSFIHSIIPLGHYISVSFSHLSYMSFFWFLQSDVDGEILKVLVLDGGNFSLLVGFVIWLNVRPSGDRIITSSQDGTCVTVFFLQWHLRSDIHKHFACHQTWTCWRLTIIHFNYVSMNKMPCAQAWLKNTCTQAAMKKIQFRIRMKE